MRLDVCRYAPGAPGPHRLQFVFTADAHYGITREWFRGGHNVDAHVVNLALVGKINQLSSARLPADGGVDAGEPVGALDFVVEGGDVANREEITGGRAIPSSAASWSQFAADYVRGITARNRAGDRSPVYVVPGNHEASNAVGFHKPMSPPTDATAIAEIFNRMLTPPVPRTPSTFDYARDKMRWSMDAGGIHFTFLQIWPDSTTRSWLESRPFGW